MKKTFKASVCISEASGMIGKKIRGAKATGELYLEGYELDFANPAHKEFTISGQVVSIESQEAIDLLRKYDVYEKVVGKVVGGIKVTVDGNSVISGNSKNDKFDLFYSAVVTPGFASLSRVVVKIDVKGFMNSMAIDDVVITGNGAA
jgi:hypothetical protein